MNRLSVLLKEEREKYSREERELKRKIYHAEVLRELSERTGYSLDIPTIIEVITGSLGELLDYHTASYLIQEENHLRFHCFVATSVNHRFLKDLRKKSVAAFSTMLNRDISNLYIEETISGTILDDTLETNIESFFNLPLILDNKIVGLITVASPKKGLYSEEETKILYTITQQAADHYNKLKQVLEEEKRKLNAMVASMADGVIMLDSELNLLVFNPAAHRMLGLTNVENPSILDIANSLSGKVDLRTKLDEAVETDQVVEQKNIILRDSALHLLISPVRDKSGELLGTSILFRDITAEKELEQMRDEFTAMMVHELRTPLTAIKGAIDMVLNEERLQEETKQKLLESTYSDTEQMLELVGDLLDVAKMEAGKFQIEKQKADLVEVINGSVEKFRPQAKLKGLKIDLQIADELPELRFDKIRIGQVLNNLLSNAIKYTEKGVITVSAEALDQSVRVKVQDTGVGLEESALKGLFSKFKQFGKGKSGEVTGTGLGLVIAKGIIEAHNGDIGAESDGRGQGSTFFFKLPIKDQQAK